MFFFKLTDLNLVLEERTKSLQLRSQVTLDEETFSCSKFIRSILDFTLDHVCFVWKSILWFRKSFFFYIASSMTIREQKINSSIYTSFLSFSFLLFHFLFLVSSPFLFDPLRVLVTLWVANREMQSTFWTK